MFYWQAQLTRSTAAEEANLAEIQRLSSSAADMQAELAFRPTRADIDDLSAVVGSLRQEVIAKDLQIQRLHASLSKDICCVDKAVETSLSLEDLTKLDDAQVTEEDDPGKISAEIDEMFRLDYEDDEDESDSVPTEINRDEDAMVSVKLGNVASAGEYVRLDDEQRVQVTLQNGTLHALEEELVRAKERWAEASEERARLAAQLAVLRDKPAVLTSAHIIAIAVPIVAACIYYLLLPYIS